MSISLSKEERVARIDLRKKEVAEICTTLGINGQKARVAGVVDISGSTTRLFSDGTMQEVVERLIPLALQFDDNGEIDMWDFSSGSRAFHRLPSASVENFHKYVDREILPHHGGGTQYAPVLEDVSNFYFPKEKKSLFSKKEASASAAPVFVMFFTDGDNDSHDKDPTIKLIREMSKGPVFIQFIGIGTARKSFLEALNDLEGTFIDNCGFCDIRDISRESDSSLYGKLLNEFPQWLTAARKAKLIV